MASSHLSPSGSSQAFVSSTPSQAQPQAYQGPVVRVPRTSSNSSDPVTLPLVWNDPTPAMELSPEQLSAYQGLWDKFVQDVGGPEQNVDNPAYRERWIAAQEASDEKFRALYGWEALSHYHPDAK